MKELQLIDILDSTRRELNQTTAIKTELLVLVRKGKLKNIGEVTELAQMLAKNDQITDKERQAVESAVAELKKELKVEKTLSNLKKGDWFRFKGHKKTYIFEGGGKVKGFNYCGSDDINDHHSTKTDRVVELE